MIHMLIVTCLWMPPVPTSVFNKESDQSWHRPLDIALAPGRFYTLDKDNYKIRAFTEDGSMLKTFSGQGQAPGESQGGTRIGVFGQQVWACDSVGSAILIFTLEGELIKKINLSTSPNGFFMHDNGIIIAPISLGSPFYVIDNMSLEITHNFGLNDTSFIDTPKGYEDLWLASVSTLHKGGIVNGLIWKGQTIQIEIPLADGKINGKTAKVSNIWDGEAHIVVKEIGGMPGALALNDIFSGPDGLVWMSILGKEEDKYPTYVLRVDTANHKVISKSHMGEPIRRMRFFKNENLVVFLQGNDEIHFFEPGKFIN